MRWVEHGELQVKNKADHKHKKNTDQVLLTILVTLIKGPINRKLVKINPIRKAAKLKRVKPD